MIQELFAISRPNHAEGVYIIRNLLRYIIRPKVWISSSRSRMHAGAWWDTRAVSRPWWYTPHFVWRWYAKPAAWINQNRTFVSRQKFCFCCERAVKRCIKQGKNSEKYTRKLLDKLEFDYLFLYMTNSGFSPFSSYEHIRRKSIFATIPKHLPKSLSNWLPR